MVIGDFSESRHNNFDIIRFCTASLIVLYHSFPLSVPGFDHTGYLWIEYQLLGIFFAVSGFLIMQSWERSPRVFYFLKKRLLRIMPALICTVLLAAFVIGPLVTTLSWSAYIHHPAVWDYLKNILLYNTWFLLPGVFEDVPFKGSVNGALWTLPYEARCYLLLVVLGVLRIRTWRKTAAFLFLAAFSLLVLDWPALRLTIFFVMGILFYLFRDKIPLSDSWAVFSVIAVGLAVYLNVGVVYVTLCYGTYLVFYFAFHPRYSFHNFGKYGDFSYGIYVYAFPVQQCVIHYFHPGSLYPLQFFAIQYPLILCIAALSWHLIEWPCLRLK